MAYSIGEEKFTVLLYRVVRKIPKHERKVQEQAERWIFLDGFFVDIAHDR